MSLAWLKYVITRPMNLLLILSLGSCEAHRLYLDYRLKSLCNEYGGVEVFERISVGAEEFESLKENISYEKYAPQEAKYFKRSSSDRIYSGRVVNFEKLIVTYHRKQDGKTIGQFTSFHRKGGGIPIPLAPDNAKSCYSLGVPMADSVESIFYTEESKTNKILDNE